MVKPRDWAQPRHDTSGHAAARGPGKKDLAVSARIVKTTSIKNPFFCDWILAGLKVMVPDHKIFLEQSDG